MTRPRSPLRDLGAGAYAPNALVATGTGAIAPVIPVTATALGATTAQAGLALAAMGVGQLVADVPAGRLVQRVGERRAMVGATVLLVVALAGLALAATYAAVVASVFAVGLASSVYGLARQAYITAATPLEWRARALSTLGGTQRIGSFGGPFLGAGVLLVTGTSGVYWMAALLALAGTALIGVLPDLPTHEEGVARVPLRRMAHEHARTLRTLGVAVAAVGAVRAGRQAVLPLWAVAIGLDPATTSVVFGISGAVDALLFYPGGRLMDRRGRVAVAVPTMLGLGASLALLTAVDDVVGMVAVAVLMGVSNGIGAGIVMTLGADAAPPGSRAEFLGVWRLCADVGFAGGPLVLSGMTAVASLASGAWVLAGVALGGAWLLHRYVPRTAPVA